MTRSSRGASPSSCPIPTWAGRRRPADSGTARAALGDDHTPQTGTARGTARSPAPEQVDGGVPDRRSDVSSLGVVLYEMVCGRPPFHADTELALALQHLRDDPPPP